jgi:hypothetical protein
MLTKIVLTFHCLNKLFYVMISKFFENSFKFAFSFQFHKFIVYLNHWILFSQ